MGFHGVVAAKTSSSMLVTFELDGGMVGQQQVVFVPLVPEVVALDWGSRLLFTDITILQEVKAWKEVLEGVNGPSYAHSVRSGKGYEFTSF